MYQDPDLLWDGPFPYDVLAPAGITPYSTIAEVWDAITFFTKHRQGADGQSAWKTLRVAEDRLLIDFFLYRTPPEHEAEEGERE